MHIQYAEIGNFRKLQAVSHRLCQKDNRLCRTQEQRQNIRNGGAFDQSHQYVPKAERDDNKHDLFDCVRNEFRYARLPAQSRTPVCRRSLLFKALSPRIRRERHVSEMLRAARCPA
jgi:hypothetical protein